MQPSYELRDDGDRWSAVRDGIAIFGTWDREANPHGDLGLLAQVGFAVERRWGRPPTWTETDTGWVAS